MDLSFIESMLPRHRSAQLTEAVTELEDAIEAQFVRNARFVECKRIVNLTVEEVASAHNQAARDWRFDVLVMGAHSLPSALAEATRTDAFDRAEVLSSLLPLHQLLQSVKPYIVKRGSGDASISAPQPKVRKMTCQICGRAIAAETGIIARHGFRRPWGGGQTASCDGAMAAPFEASRNLIAEVIDVVERCTAAAQQAIDEVEGDRAPVTVRIRDRSAPFGARDTIDITLTRENADEMLAELPPDGGIPLVRYEQAKARDIAFRQMRIGELRLEAASLRQRYDGWKMTHEWVSKTRAWKSIDGADGG